MPVGVPSASMKHRPASTCSVSSWCILSTFTPIWYFRVVWFTVDLP